MLRGPTCPCRAIVCDRDKPKNRYMVRPWPGPSNSVVLRGVNTDRIVRVVRVVRVVRLVRGHRSCDIVLMHCGSRLGISAIWSATSVLVPSPVIYDSLCPANIHGDCSKPNHQD